MQAQYSPLLGQYQSLWQKYGIESQKCFGSLSTPTIVTQEDAIKWSLKLREFFESKAKEFNCSGDDLRRLFVIAAKVTDKPLKTIVHSVMSIMYHAFSVEQPVQASAIDIDKYGLWFDFQSVDDLFLLDENDISSVIFLE